MLDLAISAGRTAIAGDTISDEPNCSINANAEYGVQAIMKAITIRATIDVTRVSARFVRPMRAEF